ncbi:MAG: TRAP transporter small permease subunit [Pseudolabrys sp.]|nr:TRAP transporter small permease subunit [Pseudolabrys sp.]
MIGVLFAFLLNNYLNYWQGWPSASSVFSGPVSLLGLIQAALYVLAIAIAIGHVLRSRTGLLRPDSEIIYNMTGTIVRGAFWAVLLVGLADAVISFLRVEGMLPALIGDKLTIDLGRSSFRGTWVHFPLIVIGVVIARFHRGLGFPWLALLVVGAEMLIVISRFIFSYEQAFMADLVRFWYGALFLFASAYTLMEEGHVRVDVLYAAFKDRTKGIVNAICCIILGMSLCWTIIIYGMGSQSAVINSPLLAFEVTQTGFGMYVKYWMAGFLAVYAVTMLLQFSGYFLESIADFVGEPGKRKLETGVAHETYET